MRAKRSIDVLPGSWKVGDKPGIKMLHKLKVFDAAGDVVYEERFLIK